MKTEQLEQRSSTLTAEKVLALVSTLTGGGKTRERENAHARAGRWDGVIRAALRLPKFHGPGPDPFIVRHLEYFGPSPLPWFPGSAVSERDSIAQLLLSAIARKNPGIWDGVIPHGLSEEFLNPQPLPPRYAFMAALADEVISRAEFFQEAADAMGERGIIVIGGYVADFADDLCPPNFTLPHWPFPGPRPTWYTLELESGDLLVLGSRFSSAASTTFFQPLGQAFSDAGAKFANTAVSRME
jgi:hypothetical protein